MPDTSHRERSTEGAEGAAIDALNRGIELEEAQDIPGAARAYLEAMELGRLSNTGPGLEVGAQAAFNLASAPRRARSR